MKKQKSLTMKKNEINVNPSTDSIDLNDTNNVVVEFIVSRVNKTEELQLVIHHSNIYGEFETVPIWLSRKQVAQLVPYLSHFSRTGELVGE